jgi:hypothetical protein
MKGASMIYNVYTGDGNDGCSFDHEIEADDLDGAVADYMKGVAPENRDLFNEEGDDEVALLTVYEGPEGEVAYNGGAYFCAEIHPADKDPRGKW